VSLPLLKDKLFNREQITYLAGLFADSVPGFDRVTFIRHSLDGLSELELKQRITHIIAALEKVLPSDFAVAASQIRSALPPPLDPTLSDNDFGDFILACLGEYVVRNGLTRNHLKRSLRLLRELTMRFSVEDAIRYFINSFPEETFAELQKWAGDRNYHVRRLVSEGTRPLLPWSGRLRTDPLRPLPLLDRLHSDRTRYVTRSVANHLNDIAKTQPAVVIETLRRWRKLGAQDDKELAWMTRHALRTLVKRGDPDAMQLLGCRSDPSIKVSGLSIRPQVVRPGETITFSFDISATRDESLLIDYVIEFVKSRGATAQKVHKLKKLQMRRGQTLNISRRHLLKANATTFKFYPGLHRLTLQINGNRYDTGSFTIATD
jgi:3-methyladenine DNA glycosylase AlkC